MSEDLISQELERDVSVKRVRKEDPAAARCGTDFLNDSTRYVDLLVYEREMPNGGERCLTIDEDGDITLSGQGPTLRSMGWEDISYNSDIDSIGYEPGSFSDLQAYSEDAGRECYDELDELLYTVEGRLGPGFE